MSSHYEKYKSSMYEYQSQHRDKLREIDLKHKNKKYADNEEFRASCRQKVLARYYYKKEIKEFMNILLD